MHGPQNVRVRCVCVALSYLSQKFAIWFLAGAFKFNIVPSTSTTSVSDIGSMPYWDFVGTGF